MGREDRDRLRSKASHELARARDQRIARGVVDEAVDHDEAVALVVVPWMHDGASYSPFVAEALRMAESSIEAASSASTSGWPGNRGARAGSTGAARAGPGCAGTPPSRRPG